MMGEVSLPVLSDHIDNITQKELRMLLASVIRACQGRSTADYSQNKPVWWSKEIAFAYPRKDPREDKASTQKPWTEVLRSMVKRCYKHHGQQHLLTGSDGKTDAAKGSSAEVVFNSSRRDSSPLKVMDNQQNLPVTGSSTLRSLLSRRESSPFRILNRDGSPLRIINRRNGSPVRMVSRSRECSPLKIVTDNEGRSSAGYNSGSQYGNHVPSTTPKHGTVPVPARLFRSKTSVRPNNQLNNNAAGLLRTSPNRRLSPRLAVTKSVSIVEEDNAFVEIFICFFCEKEFKLKVDLQQHQVACSMRPPELDAEMLGPPLSPMARPPRLWVESPDTYKRAPKRLFVEHLGLLPQAKAEALETQKRVTKIDCDVIDVDENSPKSPTTPRTPKSLISQLSRDVSSPTRRSLSLSDNAWKTSGSMDVEDSDTESECSKSESDTSESNFHVRRSKSLYTIDFSSPLGERVKKHMCMPSNIGPSFVNIDKFCGNYDEFCQTPEKHLQDRLRSRGSGFTVSFKKTRRTDPKYYHSYKFTKRQRREHYLTIDTGLNRVSRALKRTMRKCHVRVHRLSSEEILRWTQLASRKPSSSFVPLSEVDLSFWAGQRPHFSDSDLDAEDAIFPGSPGLFGNPMELQRLLGLKTKIDLNEREKSPAPPLELSQVVSEDINAEVNEQKVIVYRTVLSELSRRSPLYQEDLHSPQPTAALVINTNYATEYTPPSSPEDILSDQSLELYPTGIYRSHMKEFNKRQVVKPFVTKSRSTHSSPSLTNKIPDIRTAKIVSRKQTVSAVQPKSRPAPTSDNRKLTLLQKAKTKPTKKPSTNDTGTRSQSSKNKVAQKPIAKKSVKNTVATKNLKILNKMTSKKGFTKSKAVVSKKKTLEKKLTKTFAKKKSAVGAKKTQLKTLKKMKRVLTRQSSASPASSTRLQSKTIFPKGSETTCKQTAKMFSNAKLKVEKHSASELHKPRSVEGNRKDVNSKPQIKAAQPGKSLPVKRNSSNLAPSELQSTRNSNQVQQVKTRLTASDSVALSDRRKGCKRPAVDEIDQRPSKEARRESLVSPKSAIPALLFKCHLCHAEIACKANFKQFIMEHFATAHAVRSIHLVEQKSATGEMVLSIIEDTVSPDKESKRPAKKTSLTHCDPDFEVSPATRKLLSKFARSQSMVQRKLFDSSDSDSLNKRSQRLLNKQIEEGRAPGNKHPARRMRRAHSQPGGTNSGLSWFDGE